MSDFQQAGTIATLHRLAPAPPGLLEGDLRASSARSPIALVLPCLADEFDSPAMRAILNVLSTADYLSEIVVGLDAATPDQLRKAHSSFSRTHAPVTILWNDGPDITNLLASLRNRGIPTDEPGKGLNLWLCIGALLAKSSCKVLAVHDCDILTYDAEFLARLCHPVVYPDSGFRFCKGFSARFSDRLHGRVMRLLFAPLIRALSESTGGAHLLSFLGEFRYPLSGEFSVCAEAAAQLAIPGNWGVEAGILSEVFRTLPAHEICQAECGGRFDHKHRDLSPDDASRGLNKMSSDVAGTLFDAMARNGSLLDKPLLDALPANFLQSARQLLHNYRADARINGLTFDADEEERAVTTFAGSVHRAAISFLARPRHDSFLPAWQTIASMCPDVLPALREIASSSMVNSQR